MSLYSAELCEYCMKCSELGTITQRPEEESQANKALADFTGLFQREGVHLYACVDWAQAPPACCPTSRGCIDCWDRKLRSCGRDCGEVRTDMYSSTQLGVSKWGQSPPPLLARRSHQGAHTGPFIPESSHGRLLAFEIGLRSSVTGILVTEAVIRGCQVSLDYKDAFGGQGGENRQGVHITGNSGRMEEKACQCVTVQRHDVCKYAGKQITCY